MESKKQPNLRILFFDGVCHLCNRSVDFAIQNGTPANPLIFAPLQGETAVSYLDENDRRDLNSVVFYDQGEILRESKAVFRLLSYLKFPLSTLGHIGQRLPKSLTDRIYRWVAKHRLEWFGEREFCRLPKPEERNQLWP